MKNKTAGLKKDANKGVATGVTLTENQKKRIEQMTLAAKRRGLVLKLTADNRSLLWLTPQGKPVWRQSTDSFLDHYL